MNEQTLSTDASGILFDGDDTLWLTEPLYDEARQSARAVVNAAGANGAEWEERQRRIDVENVSILGFSAERFPTSCVQAYEQLCQSHGATADPNVVVRIRDAARSVFERDPEVVTGARDTLSLLRRQGVRLALLTKGDCSVQKRRVAHSGLNDLFDVVRIVPEKTPDTIRAVLADLGVALERAWTVGNSIRSDIVPALEAGVRAIWIEAHVWEYERDQDHLADDRVVVVPMISDVPTVIELAERAGEMAVELRRRHA